MDGDMLGLPGFFVGKPVKGFSSPDGLSVYMGNDVGSLITAAVSTKLASFVGYGATDGDGLSE